MKKYLIEGALIVFSVLFALFINKAFADYQLENKKEIAIEAVKKELNTNLETITRWKEKHAAIQGTLSDIIEGRNDSLKTEFKKYNFLNLGIITNNESLVDAFLTNTAWESMKTTGLVAEFDFNTVEKLTHVYSLQDIIINRTTAKLMDTYFERESQNIDNLHSTLIQFQLGFSELIGQENLLYWYYQEALKELE